MGPAGPARGARRHGDPLSEQAGLPALEASIRCDSFAQLNALLGGTSHLALVPRLVLQSGVLGSRIVEMPVTLTPAAALLAAMFISYARTLRSQWR